MKLRSTSLLLLGLASLSLPATAQNTSVTYQSVALTGQRAPNTEANVFYSYVDENPWLTRGTLSSPGAALVLSTITGPGVNPAANDVGLWEGPIGGLTLLARTGATPPGTSMPAVFESFDGLYRNSSGGPVAFGATIGGVLSDVNTGIWFRPTSLSDQSTLIVREGDAVPRMVDQYFGDFSPVQSGSTFLPGYHIADTKGTVFIQAYTTTGIPLIAAYIPDTIPRPTLATIAYQGDLAPGAAGASYASCPQIFRFVTHFPQIVLQFNANGQIVYRASLAGSGVTSLNDTGLWSGVPRNMALLAREGDAAASGNGYDLTGLKYGDFVEDSNFAPIIVSDSRITFTGTLDGAGVDNINKYGIWAAQAGGSPSLLLRSGTLAATINNNAVFYGQFSKLAGANNTWLFFQTRLLGEAVTGSNDEALYAGKGANFQLIAREGQAVPGLVNTVYKSFTRIAINSSGFVAFAAELDGTSITLNNDEALFVGTPGDPTANPPVKPTIRLVAVEGGTAPESTGTTFGANFFNKFQLNEANEVVFAGKTNSLTDGSKAGIWALTIDGTVVLIAREGARVPTNVSSDFVDVLNPTLDEFILLDNNGGIEFPVTFSTSPLKNGVLRAKLGRVIDPKVVTPSANPVAGTYPVAQNVVLNTTTPGATIRYTTNGNDPDNQSTIYTTPFNVPADTTLKAYATRDGFIDSDIFTAVYNIKDVVVGTAGKPVVTPNGGTFSVPQVVQLSSPSEQPFSIFYTIDGSDPKTSATRQLYTEPFTLTATCFVRAYTTKTDYVDSAETSAAFFFTGGNTPAEALLALSGPAKIKVSSPKVILSGTANSKDGIARIEYSVNGGPFLRAKGTKKWKINFKAKLGKTKVQIVAYSTRNVPSNTKTVTVTYKKKARSTP